MLKLLPDGKTSVSMIVRPSTAGRPKTAPARAGIAIRCQDLPPLRVRYRAEENGPPPSQPVVTPDANVILPSSGSTAGQRRLLALRSAATHLHLVPPSVVR